MSDSNKCDGDGKAEYVVAWGNSLKKCCKYHAELLKTIGEVMGSPAELQPIVTEEKCYQANEK